MADPNGQFKDKDVTWGIGQSLGIGLLAFLLPQVIVAFVLAFIASVQGVDLQDLISEDNIGVTFALSASISLLGTLIVWLYLKRKNVFKRLGFKKIDWDDVWLAIPGYAVYFVLAFIANIALVALYPELAEQEQDTGFTNAAGIELMMAFVALVIIAPVYEELLFRGFVFRGLAKATSFWPAALTVSFLFGLAHGQLNVAVDTFLVGMVASWLVWHTKSIWPAILLHVIKNFVAYIFLFVLEV